MEHMNRWKAAMTALIGALTGLWGWLGWLVVGWIALMAMDYIVGTLAANLRGEWESKVARDGIKHKLGMVVVVVVAAGADGLLSLVLAHLPLVEMPFVYSGLICPMVLVWYCITELGSLAETAVVMGAPCPTWLTKILAVSKETVDKVGESVAGGRETEET